MKYKVNVTAIFNVEDEDALKALISNVKTYVGNNNGEIHLQISAEE